MNLKNLEVWFVTGSQHLYGEETLKQVAVHSQEIAETLNASSKIPVSVVFKPVLTTPDAITSLCVEANTAANCIGIITWMHTFSPSKMWINGLKILNKPVAHLHTQYNRDIPWSEMDMDFMNLNQSAHGDREHGFIFTRLRKNRKVVVGYWKDEQVQERLGIWSRACAGWYDWQSAKFARFGDNMREVAVTEGDKVEAQLRFGFSVNYFPMGDLVAKIDAVTEVEVDKLYAEYNEKYLIDAAGKPGAEYYENVRTQARIELGMRAFLEEGGFKGFTTTFEDLYGLKQLPGLAVQRLMEDGYGFGAEGDWKHAALVRAMKVMSIGLPGGTSFMEDYTYHLDPSGMKALGAHMLEVCPTIGDGKTKIEVHPLGIGGKDAPARMVFNVPAGPAIAASIIDMGNRFRMIVNDVDVEVPEHDLPKLPVARALWTPQPNLQVGAGAWILAGGAHHTSFSKAITAECIEDFCEIADIEFVNINKDTCLTEFKKELRWNEMFYLLNKALK
ncbi:MAG: L-arabinose isomerase [Bacteroidota bacterium]|nr:L-arabinose isomerase [Bacteroidota bacterium]MDP4206045.1 L-arabinose isomerase [Bacteroidota bacterium]